MFVFGGEFTSANDVPLWSFDFGKFQDEGEFQVDSQSDPVFLAVLLNTI